jgi:hypothetical protein
MDVMHLLAKYGPASKPMRLAERPKGFPRAGDSCYPPGACSFALTLIPPALYLFGDKYVFSILPNQQRARSDFCLILYMVNYGRVGKYIMRKSKRYAIDKDGTQVADAALCKLDLPGLQFESATKMHLESSMWRVSVDFKPSGQSSAPVLIELKFSKHGDVYHTVYVALNRKQKSK